MKSWGPKPEKKKETTRPRPLETYVPQAESFESPSPLIQKPTITEFDPIDDHVEDKSSSQSQTRSPTQFKFINNTPIRNQDHRIISSKGAKKAAVANIVFSPGTGKIIINNRNLIDYFPILAARETVLSPFLVTETLGQFDINVKASGGGWQGQAVATRLAISRALQKWDPAYRLTLKRVGFLERDARKVERKKPGQPKARKKHQWVKR